MRFFHTFIGSFYSVDTYRTVRQSRGHGLAYSFLLVTLAGIIATIVCILMLNQILLKPTFGPKPLFDDVITQVADQLPVMTLKDNQLMTREPQAHKINLNVTAGGKVFDDTVAVIDTTGATNYNTMQTPVLITSKEIIVKGKTETKIQTFEELNKGKNPTLVINHALAQEMGTTLIAFVHSHAWEIYFVLGLFCCIGFVIVYYILRLCMLLALTASGLLLGKLLKTEVTFETAMRMAAVSYTPVLCVQWLSMFLAEGRSVSAIALFFCGLVTLAMSLYITRDTPLAEAA